MRLINFRKIGLIFIFLLISSSAFALRSRKDYFLNPQVGLWFGPITPVYHTRDDVDTDLGIGLFFRHNFFWKPLKIGLDASYQPYESKGINELTLIPVYGNFLYLLPLDLPVRFQLKAGSGGCYVKAMPDDHSQWDPLFMTGVEISFPAGRIVNIALRIDYLYIFEGYIDGADYGGHVINTGISIYFNFN